MCKKSVLSVGGAMEIMSSLSGSVIRVGAVSLPVSRCHLLFSDESSSNDICLAALTQVTHQSLHRQCSPFYVLRMTCHLVLHRYDMIYFRVLDNSALFTVTLEKQRNSHSFGE